MKELVTIFAFLLVTSILQAQQSTQPAPSITKSVEQKDLTGTWEGEFVYGTIGMRQAAKMVLEIVQVEGKMYCIVDIYPVDTKEKDKPNITYTFEGDAKPENIIYSLIQGRVVHGISKVSITQFLFELKAGGADETLAGRWFRELEPINSRERGAGTFTVKRTNGKVSDRLLLPRQQKEILEKLEKQNG